MCVNGRRFSRPVLSTTQPPLHRSDELQAYPDAESLCREARLIDGPPVDSPRAHSPRCGLHIFQYFELKYVTIRPRQGHHQRELDTQGPRVLYLAGRRERNGSGQSDCRGSIRAQPRYSSTGNLRRCLHPTCRSLLPRAHLRPRGPPSKATTNERLERVSRHER